MLSHSRSIVVFHLQRIVLLISYHIIKSGSHDHSEVTNGLGSCKGDVGLVLYCWAGCLVLPEVLYLQRSKYQRLCLKKSFLNRACSLRSHDHSIIAAQRCLLSHGTVSTGNLLLERGSLFFIFFLFI